MVAGGTQHCTSMYVCNNNMEIATSKCGTALNADALFLQTYLRARDGISRGKYRRVLEPSRRVRNPRIE